MPRNPILDELREVREAMLANAGGTTAGLVAMLEDQQQRSGRQVLDEQSLPRNRRTNRCNGAAKSGGSAMGNPLSPPADR